MAESNSVVTPATVRPDDAAHYLSTSTDTIDRAIHAGILPIVRLPVARGRKTVRGIPGVGRHVLIDRKDLDALIERGKELP